MKEHLQLKMTNETSLINQKELSSFFFSNNGKIQLAAFLLLFDLLRFNIYMRSLSNRTSFHADSMMNVTANFDEQRNRTNLRLRQPL